MTKAGEAEDWHGRTRQPLPPETLKEMSAAVVVVAFSSTDWIARTFRCTEDQAREFKTNAQADFDSLMTAARQARGRFA